MLPLYSRALMTKVFPRTLPSGQETPCHLFLFKKKKKLPIFFPLGIAHGRHFPLLPTVFSLFLGVKILFFPIFIDMYDSTTKKRALLSETRLQHTEPARKIC